MVTDASFVVLAKNEHLIAGSIFELSYLIHKFPYQEIYMGDFYGNPFCALIDNHSKWCLIGGDTLSVWTFEKGVILVDNEQLKWISKMCQTDEFTAELFVEEHSGNRSGLWKFDLKSLENSKLRDM